jgi:tetratricopeptide (TPR) repeat protein
MSEHAQALHQAIGQLSVMEAAARTNPADIKNLLELGGSYLQMQQTGRALEVFDTALGRPEIKFQDTAAIAQYYAQMGNYPKLETAIKKLVSLAPDQPEPCFDLAALESIMGHATEGMQYLKQALEINARRLAKDPAARDLRAAVRTDDRFKNLRALPEFQQLVPAK